MGEETWALPAVAMTWLREIFWSFSLFGSTCTWSCWSRMPQMLTSETPWMPSSFGLIVQRAMTERWIGVRFLPDRPIIMTRLCDDSGGSTTGARETLANAAPFSWVRRSWTSWRPL